MLSMLTGLLFEALASVVTSQVLSTAFICLLVYFVYIYAGPPLWSKTKVFRQMGVPYISPIKSRLQADSLFLFSRKSLIDVDTEHVKHYGKVFGTIESTGPILMIAEPELLREIFVKEFNHFYNRREALSGTSTVLAESVFFQRDQRWHDLRSLISPTFSSAKMRSMDGLIWECLQISKAELDLRFSNSQSDVVEIDARRYFSNFAMDVVGTVFFGVDVAAITNRDNPFVKESFKIFAPLKRWAVLIFFLFPSTYVKKLLVKNGLIGFPTLVPSYFETVIPQMIRDRRQAIDNNLQRKDFLNLLITARERTTTTQGLAATGTLDDDDTGSLDTGAKVNNSEQSSADGSGKQQQDSERLFQEPTAQTALTDDEIAAQCFVFMIAGFETTSTAIGFLCHELAVNQDVQERLRTEVNSVVGVEQQLTYDKVTEMRLLDACISETLRLYPPVGRLERECAEDCTLSNGLEIKKGVIVVIPSMYIQRSAENFVDPDKFDPDRFYDAERRALIKPYTYLPFGQGPRNCVGMRFALLELKMLTAFVVQNYRIVPTENTKHPLKFEPRTGILLHPLGGAVVGLQKLKS